jgi:hypothetical protein
MKNIKYLSAGYRHTIAVTIDGRILIWGQLNGGSNRILHQFSDKPLDIT